MIEEIYTFNLGNLDCSMLGLTYDLEKGISADNGETWFKQCPDCDLSDLEWDVKLWLKPFQYDNLNAALIRVLDSNHIYTGPIELMTQPALVEYVENKLKTMNAQDVSLSWDEALIGILDRDPKADVEWLKKSIDRWWELNT